MCRPPERRIPRHMWCRFWRKFHQAGLLGKAHSLERLERELLDFCRTRLAAYKVPRLLAFVEDLPKTGSGKILRRALRE